MTRRHIVANIVRTLAATAVIITVTIFASCTPAGQAEVVARVNDHAITAGDLMTELRLRHGPSQLIEMIDQRLIEQAAAIEDISVSADEMQLRWERAIAEAGSETDLDVILQQRNLTREQFREMLRIDLLLDRLVRASMEIDDQEVVDFYDEHADDYRRGERAKARMILLSTRENAETIAEALEAGGDFAGLAGALSIDPATKDEGGEMGWFERRDYAEAITNRAFAMEPGEISEPFEAPDGWVILKVEGHEEAGLRSLEEVRDEVRARIVRAKLHSARNEWIVQARTQAALRISDDRLRETTLSMLEDAPPPGPVTLMPMPAPMH